ncbi:DUF1311 domain-containing protein [Pseudomonas sp. PDM16]|uniref:lysozyme inhibitor LprI family protein n=1 Tax=Pseudomonas sp. PDM16 TaxID=2769292 RepID=UPI0017874956|nr:lysozyme inhibitor LprI family protein [Pseudomonas sp. PDM16]MBD9413527.1 DUF1311 domain-containing protein [Pseudomonas sp. PDM16]
MVNRLYLYTALALLVSLAPAARAGEPFCGRETAHPIDQALALATARSAGVTADLLDAQSDAWSAWDKELNRVYRELIAVAGPERREALRAAQRAWLTFDQAQEQWNAAVYADQGSSTALNLGGASLDRRRARVCDLLLDLASLEDSP